jgi:uncharacterized membrane protein
MNEVLLWAAIILAITAFYVVIIYVLLWNSGDYPGTGQASNPMSMLQDRYVKGEITADQLRLMRIELKEKSSERTIERFTRYL